MAILVTTATHSKNKGRWDGAHQAARDAVHGYLHDQQPLLRALLGGQARRRGQRAVQRRDRACAACRAPPSLQHNHAHITQP